MNLSAIAENLIYYANRCIKMINNDARHNYTPSFMDSFKINRYHHFKRIIQWYNYAISAKSSPQYYRTLHIYENLKSQILDSYNRINLNELIEMKVIKLIPISIEEFIGAYVQALEDKIIKDVSANILCQFKIKEKVLLSLVDKIRFKDLMNDYSENKKDYESSKINILLGNSDLARYLSEFIN